MTKTVVYEVEIMFGDCDPAGIVFFPNFSRWMDASSLNFFVKCGLLPWRELVKTRGIIGEKFLALSPGGGGDPLKPGDTIRDTESGLDLEELVSQYVHGKVN